MFDSPVPYATVYIGQSTCCPVVPTRRSVVYGVLFFTIGRTPTDFAWQASCQQPCLPLLGSPFDARSVCITTSRIGYYYSLVRLVFWGAPAAKPPNQHARPANPVLHVRRPVLGSGCCCLIMRLSVSDGFLTLTLFH
jgi:hypothetical protein